jgi:hypothetical protein
MKHDFMKEYLITALLYELLTLFKSMNVMKHVTALFLSFNTKNNQVEEDEMGGACSTNEGGEEHM